MGPNHSQYFMYILKLCLDKNRMIRRAFEDKFGVLYKQMSRSMSEQATNEEHKLSKYGNFKKEDIILMPKSFMKLSLISKIELVIVYADKFPFYYIMGTMDQDEVVILMFDQIFTLTTFLSFIHLSKCFLKQTWSIQADERY